MMHSDLTPRFCCGLIAWGVVALFFVFKGICHDSLRATECGATVSFRRPRSGRVGLAMLGVWIMVGCLLECGLCAVDAIMHHHPVPDWAYFALAWGLLMGGGFGGLLVSLAGPNDLDLDQNRRTYRFVSGWPLRPDVQTGPWEDIVGVFVRRTSTRGGVIYLVGIAWRQERQAYPLLGRFNREDDADALAENISVLLSLPRVTAPPQGQTSVDPVTSMLQKEKPAPAFRPFHSTLFSSPVATAGETLPNSERL